MCKGGHELVWAIARGQVAPGRAGAVDPQHPLDAAAMVFRRSATRAALGWSVLRKQWLSALPLRVSQVSSTHVATIPGLKTDPSLIPPTF